MRSPLSLPLAMLLMLFSGVAGALLLILGGLYERAPAHPEWSLPARFEAQGAFTVGCSLWDQPELQPFSDDNPNTGTVILAFSGDRSEGYELIALIDRRGSEYPEMTGGLIRISGQSCGVSIDWSAFEHMRTTGARPVP